MKEYTVSGKNKKTEILILILAALEGAGLFLLIYGFHPLLPTFTTWIYEFKRDLFQHQIGFEYFRQAPWRLPCFGSYTGYPDSFVNSVIYTDSIPILAVFFKLFRNVLPAQFQYFGLWGLLCFILQGVFAAVLLRRLRVCAPLTLAAIPLFHLHVLILFRLFLHSSLAGQWLILAGIYLWLAREDTFWPLWKKTLAWSLLCALAVGIHFYFLVMIGFILLSDLLLDFLSERNILRELSVFFCSVGAVLLSWYLYGGFGVISSPGSSGLGEAGLDALWWINPDKRSSVIPKLFDAGEGLAYPGLGILLLLALLLLLVLLGCRKAGEDMVSPKVLLSTVPFGVLLTVLAASPVLHVGGQVVFDCRPFLPGAVLRLWEIVRASARLFWPVWYVLLLLLLVRLNEQFEKRKWLFFLLLLLCCIIQYFDVVPHTARTMAKETPLNKPFTSEFMACAGSRISKDTEHLVFLSKKEVPTGYEEPALFALRNGLTINDGYFARKIETHPERYLSDLKGAPKTKTVYCIPKRFYYPEYRIILGENTAAVSAGDYLLYGDCSALSPDGGTLSQEELDALILPEDEMEEEGGDK